MRSPQRVAALALSCSSSCTGPTPITTANILVSFPGTTAADPALLLYSGREGANCVSYKPYVANPTVTLPDVSYDPACVVEMDAFAPLLGSFGNWVDPAVAGSEGWLTAAIDAGSISIALPDLTPVPLQIWLVAGAPLGVTKAKAMRDRLLDKAFPILETMGIGLSLDTTSKVLNPSLLPVPMCTNSSSISTNSAIYNTNRINVYFVQDYANIQNLTPAYNCWLQGHKEIIFVSWDNTNVVDPTLAHELGHALGLVHPNAVGGHTYLVAGFDAYNLMASNTDVTNASIGQLYAFNFSSDSWLNRAGSPFIRPVVRSCQDVWGAGVCPALTLFQTGWPP